MNKPLFILLLFLAASALYGQTIEPAEKLTAIQKAVEDWKVAESERLIQAHIAEMGSDTNNLFYADLVDLWAQTLEKKGDYLPALAKAAQAFQQYQSHRAPVRMARNAAFQASIYTILNQFEKADSLIATAYAHHAKADQLNSFRYVFALLQARLHKGEKKDRLTKAAQVRYEEADRLNTLARATTLFYDGLLKSEKRSFDPADSLFMAAHEIVLAIDSTLILYPKILYALGESAMRQNYYELAEEFLFHSLQVLSEGRGQACSESSYVWTHLGHLYQDTGKLIKSEECYLKAKEMMDSLDMQHFIYARLLSNLGHLYETRNKFSEAEEVYLQASEIYPVVLKKSNSYGSLLNTLGDLYLNLGQYNKVEEHYLEAKKVYTLTADNISFANVANRLGLFYFDSGQLEEAEKIFNEGLDALGDHNGDNLADRALLNYGLAMVYGDLEKLEEAEIQFLKAKAQMREAYGENHYGYGTFLNDYAYFFESVGRYGEALELYLQAEKIEKVNVGERDPNVVRMQRNLARMYALIKSPAKALTYYRQSYLTQIDLIYNHYSTFDEAVRLTYLRRAISTFYEYFSYALDYEGEDSLIYQDLQNINMAIKSLAIDFAVDSRQFVAAATDKTIVGIYEDWLAARKLLGEFFIKSAEEQKAASINLDSLENQVNFLEKRLIRHSNYIADKLGRKPQLTYQDVVGQLAADEAVVDIFRFRYAPPEYVSDSILYCALLTRKNDPQPTLIPLTEEKELEKLLARYQWSGDNILKNKQAEQAARQLYQILWRPLEERLQGIRKIHLSPAKLLYKVSFGGLPKGDGYLQQGYQFNYYGNIRELVKADTGFAKADPSIALVGGVAFDIDTLDLQQLALNKKERLEKEIIADTSPLSTEDEGSFGATRSSETEAAALNSLPFAYLPGSRQEIQRIGETFAAQDWELKTFAGTNALEENVKSLGGAFSPRILHLATHAYFFPAPDEEVVPGSSLSSRLRTSSNPLFRSGLALAGANYAWTTGRQIEGLNDGVLTAYEISNLDLSGTDLVVLSACETALGDIQNEEGVFGLQRAFKMAGVREMIISLWKVPDQQTLELMFAFYEYYLSSGNAAEALHRAQLKMSEKYPRQPFYWAGFILFR